MIRPSRRDEASDADDVSQRIVADVAAARDVDPLDLPLLFDVVDPDALTRLFNPGRAEGPTGPGRVIFVFAGCEVVVHSTGEVEVTAPGDGPSTTASTEHDGTTGMLD